MVNTLYLSLPNNEVCFNINSLPILEVDAIYMEQLFQNIIDNAIKFKQPDKKSIITIDAVEETDTFLITIKDNGIGIELTYKERIFQLFQRLHTDKTYQGAGLGLSICKKIVERHKGEIWIDSAGKNKGTTFFIRLPKRQKDVIEKAISK